MKQDRLCLYAPYNTKPIHPYFIFLSSVYRIRQRVLACTLSAFTHAISGCAHVHDLVDFVADYDKC